MPDVHFRLFLARRRSHVPLYREIRQRLIKHVTHPNAGQPFRGRVHAVVNTSVRTVRDDGRSVRIGRGIFVDENVVGQSDRR